MHCLGAQVGVHEKHVMNKTSVDFADFVKQCSFLIYPILKCISCVFCTIFLQKSTCFLQIMAF